MEVKPRRPWTVAVFSIITLGIYSIVSYYQVNREMRDHGARFGDAGLAGSKPWSSVIAMTIGGIVVVPLLVSLVGTVRRVQAVERIATFVVRPSTGVTMGVVLAVLLRLKGYFDRFWVLFVALRAMLSSLRSSKRT